MATKNGKKRRGRKDEKVAAKVDGSECFPGDPIQVGVGVLNNVQEVSASDASIEPALLTAVFEPPLLTEERLVRVFDGDTLSLVEPSHLPRQDNSWDCGSLALCSGCLGCASESPLFVPGVFILAYADAVMHRPPCLPEVERQRKV